MVELCVPGRMAPSASAFIVITSAISTISVPNAITASGNAPNKGWA